MFYNTALSSSNRTKKHIFALGTAKVCAVPSYMYGYITRREADTKHPLATHPLSQPYAQEKLAPNTSSHQTFI